MFLMAARSDRDNTEMELEVNTNGMIHHTSAERKAEKAMRAAVKEYHKHLGIYQPSLWERVTDAWKKSA